MFLSHAIVSVILLAHIKVILKQKKFPWHLCSETIVLHLKNPVAKEGGGVEMLSNIYQLSFFISDKQWFIIIGDDVGSICPTSEELFLQRRMYVGVEMLIYIY